MLHVDCVRSGLEHRNVESLAVGAGQHQQSSDGQQRRALSHEIRRREEVLDDLEAGHDIDGRLEPNLLDRLLDDLEPALPAGLCQIRRRLHANYSTEPTGACDLLAKDAESSTNLEKDPAADLPTSADVEDALGARPKNLLPTCTFRGGEHILVPVRVVLRVGIIVL